MIRTIAVVVMAAAALAGCNDEAAAPDERSGTFVIQVIDEQFRVRIDSPQVAAQARALINSGQARNITGEIERGNGGFNAGYSWHLKPGTVEFADLTIEVCDGRPSFVEENVDYFVDTVKQYCPWGVRVLSEVVLE